MPLSSQDLPRYQHIQAISKHAAEHLQRFIQPGMTEIDINQECTRFFKQNGVTETWYHGILTLVFVGERTKLSMSGRDYSPTQTHVQASDLVTVDFSPELDGYWSDLARSIVIGPGNEEMFEGIETEDRLHQKLMEIAQPSMTFHELSQLMNKFIEKWGYKNLDFKGTLGHSIEKNIDNRIYITANEPRKLNDCNLFTFEPHILKQPPAQKSEAIFAPYKTNCFAPAKHHNGNYGVRKEDIYYFEGDELRIL